MKKPVLKPAQTTRVKSLRGIISAPGDKSISHRALILGALSAGESRIQGLLTASDIGSAANALRQCGVDITITDDGYCQIDGVGIGGLAEPADILDLGNSGTAVRLLMGVTASHPMQVILTGDESLRKRPMKRIVDPLSQMGATVSTAMHGGLPAIVTGTSSPVPMTYQVPVASAQVKSAILLAGLNAPGKTTVIENIPTRDHTENMLKLFGAKVEVVVIEGKTHVTIEGQPELYAQQIVIPGDPSSASFPLVAGLITPDSVVTVKGVGMNERRTGLYKTLCEMGADILIEPGPEVCGEPVATVTASSSSLKGIEVPASRAPSMIDEYPILAVAAACASGKTVMQGLGELRVKESNRLQAIIEGLHKCGVNASSRGDDLTINGCDGVVPGGDGTIITDKDHRIAMAFLTLGLCSKESVTVDDISMIGSSYPQFIPDMNLLGAKINFAS